MSDFDPTFGVRYNSTWPRNLPAKVDQIKPSYLPLNSVEPIYGRVDVQFQGASSGWSLSFPDSVKTLERHRYASGMVDVNLAIPSANSIKIIDQPNGRRNYLALRNTSPLVNIYLGFGKEASTLSTIEIVPGQVYIFDTVVPQDDVYAIASGVNGSLSFQYTSF